MSCPYLERGKTAYCHAYGAAGLGIGAAENEICFSGEFGECAMLFIPETGERGKRRRRNLASRFGPNPPRAGKKPPVWAEHGF